MVTLYESWLWLSWSPFACPMSLKNECAFECWSCIIHESKLLWIPWTFTFSNPPPLFLFTTGSTSATLCQGLIQLWWQRTRRSQVQQGWHHHPAPAGGWKLVPWRDGRSSWILPHQLCPGHQTSPTAASSMQGSVWLWAERQGGWQGLLAILKGAENFESSLYSPIQIHTPIHKFIKKYGSTLQVNSLELVNALDILRYS